MPVEFKHATLDNGLTILAEVDPDAHTAASGFFVRAGARDEASEIMGVSHFLEHMMFKGTERRSADDVNREFDEIGANYNAYTTSEITCFYASVLPEHLPHANDILADILRPALREDDFTSEKGVILEEIAMYKDNPFWVLYEETMARRYGGHPLSHRVLGLDTTITSMQCGQMLDYFNNRYSADNTVVALAGRLDFDAAVEQLRKLCGEWARTDARRDMGTTPTPDEKFEMRDDKVTRCYQLMLCPAPSADDPRRYAAMLLAKALGDPDNSRLHWALVETGLAEEAQSAYDPHDGVGDYFVYASCPPERAGEVWSVIEREIDNLVDSLEESDLEKLRNKLATAVTLAGERPGGRMQRLGRLWTYLHKHLTLEEELDSINAVTIDDMRAVFEAFPFSPRTVGKMLPK
ncbi:MAG: insulinase family protein [Phycisphaeraceae bacterium]|nr:MAG: insulinase family protein [Phycisphaeraceae bacterium]